MENSIARCKIVLLLEQTKRAGKLIPTLDEQIHAF